MNRLALIIAAAGLAGTAAAQPATAIRFANGANQISVAPGTAVPVSVFATGLPNMGSQIPWYSGPPNVPMGEYKGFWSVYMDMLAGAGTWSNPTIPGGMGYQQPPFGSPGTPVGPSVTGIAIGVGFNAAITSNTLLLWTGTITVGQSDVSLSTLIRPVSNPAYVGFETGIYVGQGGINFPNVIPAANGTALIIVPAPGTLALLCLTGLATRRRR